MVWAMAVICLAISVEAPGQTAASKPSLTITASVTGAQYCANSPQMATLQLRLHLRYTNAGNQKLILYRGDDLFYQARIRPRAPALLDKPYEVVVLNARYLAVENEPIEQPRPGKLFVILQPGASYETDTTVGVGIASQNQPRDRHAILEGEHTLQLLVSTWYRSRSVGTRLRDEWQRKGFLWLDPVLSNAIIFRAERPSALPSCK
jgi:hypothetical protein